MRCQLLLVPLGQCCAGLSTQQQQRVSVKKVVLGLQVVRLERNAVVGIVHEAASAASCTAQAHCCLVFLFVFGFCAIVNGQLCTRWDLGDGEYREGDAPGDDASDDLAIWCATVTHAGREVSRVLRLWMWSCPKVLTKSGISHHVFIHTRTST